MKNYFLKIIFSIVISFSCFETFADSKNDSLVSELNRAAVDTNRIKILLSLCTQTKKRDSLFMYANKALAIAEKIKSNKWITDATVAKGRWFIFNETNFDTAVFIFRNLYERMAKENFFYGMGAACKLLASSYYGFSMDSCMYYDLKSIEFFKKANCIDDMNRVKGNLALAYWKMANFKDAIAIGEELVDYFHKTGDKKREAAQHENLGTYYRSAGDFKKSEYHYKKNLEYIHSLQTLFNLGGLYEEMKSFDAADSVYQEVLDMGKKMQDEEAIRSGNYGLASNSMNKHKYDDAINYAKEGLKSRLVDREQQSFLEEVLYKAYAAKEDFKHAFYYLQTFKARTDSFKNVESLKAVREMDAKYQNIEKQSKIELLDKEKKLKEAEADKQKAQKGYLLFSFVIIALAASLGFYNFKNKTKQKQEAERARISRDLHDDVGATLGSISIYSAVAKNKSSGNGEMNEVLEKIGDSSREMLEKMNDIVWSVNPKNDNAEELVHRMKNFAAVMLTPRQINFSFDTETISTDQLKLGMQQRKNIFLIYKEALHNIIKYADAKEVKVKVNVNGKHLIVLIHDDGKGFSNGSASAYNGNGIKNMKERATEIGGKLEITSQINKGTQIDLNIPV